MGFGDQGRGQGPGNGVALLQDCVPVCTTPSLPTVSRPHFLTVEGAQRTCCAGSGRLGLSPPGSGISGLSPWAGVLRFTSASGAEGGRGREARDVCDLDARQVVALCPYYARSEAGGLAFKGKRALQPLSSHPHLQIDNRVPVFHDQG